MTNRWEWDKAQQKVIDMTPESRVLVDAGPGTGKTAVACGRVASLIKKYDVNPNNIWLISFTRTAVQEIRARITYFLDDEWKAYAVKVATLDSHAWKIHSGFDRGAQLLGTYDENISQLSEIIREDKDGSISEYLETVQHLIVDEAQDFVGIRAELVTEIIKKLSDNCGVTVFCDEAQAIYGFSLDEDHKNGNHSISTLPQNINKIFGNQFFDCELKKVFRTQSHSLDKLFTGTRHKVMKPSKKPQDKNKSISKEIIDLADEKNIPYVGKEKKEYSENCFILYRKRVEVLKAAAFRGEKPHRIRMSGLPVCIHPWIGACLSEHTEKTLSKKKFMEYWNEKVEKTSLKGDTDPDTAWKKLIRIAGKAANLVDMKLLRQRLSQGKPPAEFSSNEIGTGGPIIGTIHASKGREADVINLMMPKAVEFNGSAEHDVDYDEETRVVYVGATRARKHLNVGSGYGSAQFSSRVEPSGRVFEKKGKGTAMVEIGRERDIDASCMAGKRYYETSEEIHRIQHKLLEMEDGITMAEALSDHECDHIYRLKPKNEDDYIALLSNKALTSDLFEIGKRIGGGTRRPPDKLLHLRIYGIRTIVVPPDSQECNDLHEPWAKSGILLAPVVLGYTKALFPYYNSR